MEIRLLNICKIGEPSPTPGDVLISRVHKSVWGKFYLRRLKKIAFVRALILWGWTSLSPLYLCINEEFFTKNGSGRWRPLIKLRKYAQESGSPTYELAQKSTVETPVPQAFPAKDRSFLASPHEHYDFPAVYVTKIRNGFIYGGTNLILVGDAVICHDLYNFKLDYTPDERRTYALIDPRRERIRWLLCGDPPVPIAVGAVFVDGCSCNYAHWLTEVLPRIALFCADERFKNIPIIVDAGLHPNIMESLGLIVGSERQIIALAYWKALRVDELYVTSVAGYVPYERRTNRLTGHSQGKFSPHGFELIRNSVLAASKAIPNTKPLPEKIFIRRNSEARKILNAAAIEEFMVAQGYAVIEPEKLSFLQQVQVYSNAKHIVGATGAAMANIIFSAKGTKVHILMSKQRNNIYWYWQGLACACGNLVQYILGEPNTKCRKGIHADFVVDLKALSEAITENSSHDEKSSEGVKAAGHR